MFVCVWNGRGSGVWAVNVCMNAHKKESKRNKERDGAGLLSRRLGQSSLSSLLTTTS